MGKIYKLKQREKYDTDKYEFGFRILDDEPAVGVWETCPFVGPEAYDLSNIDNVLNTRENDVDCIQDPRNPFYTNVFKLSKERAKFVP